MDRLERIREDLDLLRRRLITGEIDEETYDRLKSKLIADLSPGDLAKLGRFPTPSELREGLPEGCDELLLSLLHLSPARRPAPLEASERAMALAEAAAASERAAREAAERDASAAELAGRVATAREVKLCTVWSAEGKDENGVPVRDPGSVTYTAAIESAASLDASEALSAFTQRVMREAQR